MENQTYLNDNLNYTLFPWLKQKGLKPIHLDHAEGSYLYSKDGKRYIDFSSQLFNVNIGHGRSEITNAVISQMEKISYANPSFSTDIRGKLGKRLAQITPDNINKTFFTLGGAESNENAIKLARIVSGKHKIITQYRSYHGATYATATAGGDTRRFAIDSQQAPNFIKVENPYFYRCPWSSDSMEECGEMAINNLDMVIQYEGPDNIAAIMMEGESGSSGCIKYPPFYLNKVSDLCKKYGIIFIIDEVLSGFGRTGKWFGFEHHNIKPDIITLAKGLTSGYLPLGGVCVSDEIADHFNEKSLPLGLTYSAHSVSCAAALAVIDIYENENLIENAISIGKYTDKCMEQLLQDHVSIGDWRNTGMLGVIELVKNRDTKESFVPYDATGNELGIMNDVFAKISELGMFTFTKWNYIFIAPPLITTKNQIDEGLDIISKAISIADAVCE